MDDAELREIVADIRALGGCVPKRPPGCIATSEWAEAEGLNVATANRRLDARVKAGTMEKIGPVHDTVKGKRLYVWRVIKHKRV